MDLQHSPSIASVLLDSTHSNISPTLQLSSSVSHCKVSGDSESSSASISPDVESVSFDESLSVYSLPSEIEYCASITRVKSFIVLRIFEWKESIRQLLSTASASASLNSRPHHPFEAFEWKSSTSLLSTTSDSFERQLHHPPESSSGKLHLPSNASAPFECKLQHLFEAFEWKGFTATPVDSCSFLRESAWTKPSKSSSGSNFTPTARQAFNDFEELQSSSNSSSTLLRVIESTVFEC